MNRKGLEERKNDLKSQMSALLDTAKQEKRALTDEEKSKFDELENEFKDINTQIEREDKRNTMENKEVIREESKQFVEYIRNVLANREDLWYVRKTILAIYGVIALAMVLSFLTLLQTKSL